MTPLLLVAIVVVAVLLFKDKLPSVSVTPPQPKSVEDEVYDKLLVWKDKLEKPVKIQTLVNEINTLQSKGK